MAKRILIYTNHYDPEHFKINEAVNWLAQEGFQLHVLTGWPNYPDGKIFKGYGLFKKSFERRGNLTIRRLPLIPRGNGSKLRLIINYLSFFLSTFTYTLYLIFFEKKYDKILVHHTSPFFLAISAIFYKIFRRAEAVLWDLDLWPQSLEAVNIINSKGVLNWIEKAVKVIYEKFDIILVGSKSFIETALQRVNHDRVYYFPNWAEKIIEENKIQLKLDIDLNPNALKIMYTGNLGTAQGFDILCKSIIQNNSENIQWIFIGEGRYKEEMKQLLSDEIRKEKVLFIPQQNFATIPSWIAKADFLYLSLNDSKLFRQTVPAKLQGYMAMGKPILAMLAGEGASIIEEAKCGFIVPPGNTIKFDEQIKNVLNTTTGERKNIGKKGKIFYKKYFSSEIRKKELIGFIK
ncbi:glycosyltransferase family 4 protein [Flavobacteriaceae bacterium]|nr:glycosyltransferase family 4 protein [Flavobacteriaceae bacterium]